MGAPVSDYDQRQLDSMRALLTQYEHGSVGLGLLVANFECLVESIEKKDIEWAEKVLSLVHGVEEVYAAALDANRSLLEPSEQNVVDELVTKLRQLVEEYPVYHRIKSV